MDGKMCKMLIITWCNIQHKMRFKKIAKEITDFILFFYWANFIRVCGTNYGYSI
jgi:hypothetical protein